jgi:nucleoside-diphosphate-sugar epimerase
MGRCLITGSSGFLGKRLLQRLLPLTEIEEAILLTRNRSNVKLPDKKIKIIKGDVTKYGLGLSYGARKILESVDEVYHLSANTDLSSNRENIERTNTQGTIDLLDALGKEVFFNHISSAYACGNVSNPVPEDWLERPESFRNRYEESKWLAEQVIKEHHEKFGTPFMIFRPSILAYNVIPEEDLRKQTLYAYASLVHTVVNADSERNISSGLRLSGDPKSKINIIFAEDVVDLIMASRRNRDKDNILNLVSPSSISVENIAWILKEITDFDYNYQFIPNLGERGLSKLEKAPYKKTLPFVKYLSGNSPSWEYKKSLSNRDRLRIKDIEKEDIRDNLIRYLK